MQLLIDGNEVSWDVSGLRTFGEVMQEAGRRAAARGRVVSRVSVGDREISTALEKELASTPPREVGVVRITTTTPAALLQEAIDGGLDLCAAVLRDLRSVVASLKSGDISAATSLYVVCVESLATFFQLAGAVFLGIQSGAFPLPGGAASGAGELPAPPSSTAEILERLLSAQKAGDWASMASLLQERIVPNLEEWHAFLKAMRGPAPG